MQRTSNNESTSTTLSSGSATSTNNRASSATGMQSPSSSISSPSSSTISSPYPNGLPNISITNPVCTTFSPQHLQSNKSFNKQVESLQKIAINNNSNLNGQNRSSTPSLNSISNNNSSNSNKNFVSSPLNTSKDYLKFYKK